jgi:hypothetical protein
MKEHQLEQLILPTEKSSSYSPADGTLIGKRLLKKIMKKAMQKLPGILRMAYGSTPKRGDISSSEG